MGKAEQIVEAIETDFTDRRGLRQEWEQIDDEIKEEIRLQWASLVRDILAISTGQENTK